MNHKRKKPRSQRAGCKLCKPWKINGRRTEGKEGEAFSAYKRRQCIDKELREYMDAA